MNIPLLEFDPSMRYHKRATWLSFGLKWYYPEEIQVIFDHKGL